MRSVGAPFIAGLSTAVGLRSRRLFGRQSLREDKRPGDVIPPSGTGLFGGPQEVSNTPDDTKSPSDAGERLRSGSKLAVMWVQCTEVLVKFIDSVDSFNFLFSFILTPKGGVAKVSKVKVLVSTNASLPCTVEAAPNNKEILTLWYIGSRETPIYSYDQRPGMLSSGWSDASVFGDRITFLPQWHPPSLHIANVTVSDAALYRCRVDYLHSNSRLALVQLVVIVPPREIEIIPRMDPVKVGEQDDLVCKTEGGSPPPSVLWYQEGQVVDSDYKVQEGVSYNTLKVKATRSDLDSPFTCEAFNNNVSQPLTASWTRNVTAVPLTVTITSAGGSPLQEDMEAKLTCTVVGSNPPPQVTWFLQGQQVNPVHTYLTSPTGPTRSVLELEVTRGLHNKQLICRSKNLLLPSDILEDIYMLEVAYRPNATLKLGRSLDASLLREGNDIVFECHVDANPPAHQVTFLYNNVTLKADKSAGVLVTPTTLAMQRVDPNRSGRYTCFAVNAVGGASSNVVVVSIKYTPRCLVAPVLRGVGLYEPLNVTCQVDADPSNVTFTWTFSNSLTKDKPQVVDKRRYSHEGLSSTLSYKPMSENDFGRLLCYATNTVGTQLRPCVFNIVSAGPPESVVNCSVFNVTSHSAAIACRPRFNGGLPQSFMVQVRESTSHVVHNMTSKDSPKFQLQRLSPGTLYRVAVVAFNPRGSSPPRRLRFITHKEAEMHKSLPSRVAPSQVAWAVGVAVGSIVGAVGLLLLVSWCVLRARSGGTDAEPPSTVLATLGRKDKNPDLIANKPSDSVVDEAATQRFNGVLSHSIYDSSGRYRGQPTQHLQMTSLVSQDLSPTSAVSSRSDTSPKESSEKTFRPSKLLFSSTKTKKDEISCRGEISASAGGAGGGGGGGGGGSSSATSPEGGEPPERRKSKGLKFPTIFGRSESSL
ncbi:neural cell adhesion molecule 2-like [Oratosquilla oratoria]|uniref:neural cell adhesion molecule 2-like n=1 Tax=Oratosquilla oratoria TaxID=337810 RepID=UPI003F77182E